MTIMFGLNSSREVHKMGVGLALPKFADIAAELRDEQLSTTQAVPVGGTCRDSNRVGCKHAIDAHGEEEYRRRTEQGQRVYSIPQKSEER